MAKPTCDSLVTPLEALALHDAAHETVSAELHALARRLMAVSGVEHLSVGSDLDVGAESEEAPLVAYGSEDRVPKDLLESGLYDLCLLRRPAEAALAEGAVIVGVEVSFVPPVESGARKFPVVATPCDGEVRQLHTADGDALPEGIWIVSGDGDDLVVHDCLSRGVEQVHRLPLIPRLARLPASFREQVLNIERPLDLVSLPKGRWLLRTADEPCFDAEQPLGVLYDAQAVRPGQYVRPPRPKDELPDGHTIVQRLPRGLRCQVHKCGESAWLFVGDRAVDCLDCLPLAREIVANLLCDSAVLDCMMVADRSVSELQRDLKRGHIRRKVGVEFIVLDCLYLDGDDLHERPLVERLDALASIRCRGGGVMGATQLNLCEPGCLVRLSDSPYPLDWSGEGWHRVPEARREREPEPTPAKPKPVDDAATDDAEPDKQVELSRLWFDAASSCQWDRDWALFSLCCDAQYTHIVDIDIPGQSRSLLLAQNAIDDHRTRSEHIEASDERESSTMAATGLACLGVQRDDMHEVFLIFGEDRARSGRYVWQWSDDDKTWRCWKPKWQSPYLMGCDHDAEVRDAKKRGGWVAWNADALRLLAGSQIADILPINWETALEEFEDRENADFYGV